MIAAFTKARPHWPTALALFVSLGATAVVTIELSRTINAKDTSRFNTASDRVGSEIRTRLGAYVDMLRAGAALMSLEPNLDSDSFRRFVDQIDVAARYPGVQRIAFSRSGSSTANDPLSEPERRAAMERARDTADAAATAPFVIGNGAEPSRGFFIYFPVFDDGIPKTVEERRARLRGYVYGLFRTSEFFPGIWGTGQRPLVTFELFDALDTRREPLYRTPLFPPQPRFQRTLDFDVYGRPWTVRLRSTPFLDEASQRGLVPAIFIAGLGFTLLVTSLIHMQTRARGRVERSENRVHELLNQERRLREEAERVGRVKDEFLATLSHELRTPLNAIVGWSHLMADPELPAAMHVKALDAVQRNAKAQTQLIADLLDMSRIASGKVTLEIKAVDISEIVEAALNVVRPAAEAKQVALDASIDPSTRPIRGDAARLQQVLWNLLNNAMKFTPSGGHVHVDVRPAGSNVTIAVSDTGAGIDTDFLPHVFERFRQGDGTRTRQHGGLGLGLSIVKSLVEMHGGTVSAASAGPGRGSVFTISMPALPAGGGTDAGGQRRAETDIRLLDATRVLVVEDDPDARDLLGIVLRSEGADVTLLSSAREALNRITQDDRAFHLIVSDLAMPGIDGFEFLRRVRSLASSAREIPAIAVSAYARAEDRALALSCGYQMHVPKPYEAEDLIAACVAILGGGVRNSIL